MIYVRTKLDYEEMPRAFGPKADEDPSCGWLCPACGEPMLEGQYTALVPLGPGGDTSEQEKAKSGGYFNAVAVECHFECVTGRRVEAQKVG